MKLSWNGFSKKSYQERLELLKAQALLSSDRQTSLEQDEQVSLAVADYEKVFFEEVELDETNSAQFAGYENQDFALVEIVDHQRRYSKVEK